MAEFTDREHYIPMRKNDLVARLLKDARLSAPEKESFRQFATLVGSLWHFEYYETLEKLKDNYAPFDPDTTTRALVDGDGDNHPREMDKFFDKFVGLMEKANFKRLSRKDIDEAVEGGASDWGVNMHVDFDVFERLEIFVRGETEQTRTKKHPIFFWRKETKKVNAFQRLVLLVKMRKHKRLPENIDTDRVFIKMFKDIPKLDLEMVLPGTNLQMPLLQKWKLGGSAIGTIGYGLYSVWTKLLAAVTALVTAAGTFTITAFEYAFVAPFVLLFGYGYKQYAGYQFTRLNYSKMLADSLYYQNLDNNGGVITQLMDEAEEQECRETLLAYFYLWKYAPPEGWSAQQLDDYIELELEGKFGLKVDFEVGDAIGKLEKLGIVSLSGDKYRAVTLDKAKELLDHRWDNYFQYNRG